MMLLLSCNRDVSTAVVVVVVNCYFGFHQKPAMKLFATDVSMEVLVVVVVVVVTVFPVYFSSAVATAAT